MCEEYGPVSRWPYISPRKPSWFNRKQRRKEKRVCQVLGISSITDEMRDRFWEQIFEGQGFTDATGYRLRCWRALLGMPFLPAWVSFSEVRHDAALLEKYGLLEE